MKVGDQYKVFPPNLDVYVGDEKEASQQKLTLERGDIIKLVEVGRLSIKSCGHPITVVCKAEVYDCSYGTPKKLSLHMFSDERFIENFFTPIQEGKELSGCSGNCKKCDNSIYEKILKSGKYFNIDFRKIPEIWPKYKVSILKDMYRIAALGMKFRAEKKGDDVLIEAPNLHGLWLVSMENFKELVRVG